MSMTCNRVLMLSRFGEMVSGIVLAKVARYDFEIWQICNLHARLGAIYKAAGYRSSN